MNPIFTAIGNACTDLVANVDDAFLEKHALRKYICTHFSTFDELQSVKNDMPPFRSFSGGAGANVAHIVAALGGESHFISKIGGDREGQNFKTHMQEQGITCHFSPAQDPSRHSSQVLTLITPDGERTFASYDDVARTFYADDYDFDLIRAASVLYLDGYSFCSPATGEGFIRAADANRASGGQTILNLGDISILEANEAGIRQLIPHCSGLICNFTEAATLYASSDISTLLSRMMAGFEIGAITHGAEGAYVFADGHFVHVPAADISGLAMMDTNGAGDHFSGGFLYGMMNGFSPEQSGQLGNLCARDCLSHAGARPKGGFGSLKHLAENLKS